MYSLVKYYQKIPTLLQKPIIDNQVVKGTIQGVIGRLLVVKDKNSFYVTNLTQLYGNVLSKVKPDNSEIYSKQRTIFDYRD